MELANHYVEQVLYYAKGEYAWKDYLLEVGLEIDSKEHSYTAIHLTFI